MSKSLQVLQTGIKTMSTDATSLHSSIPLVTIPEAHLHITCPCGEVHKISLNDLPATTTRQVQVKEECPYGQYFIVHSGHPKYRKILVVADYGDK